MKIRWKNRSPAIHALACVVFALGLGERSATGQVVDQAAEEVKQRSNRGDGNDRSEKQQPTESAETLPTELPEKVSVEPLAADHEIASRIERILDATEWYDRIKVKVGEGVVMLEGEAGREEQRQWATDLAQKTEDVVAVVNRMTVAQKPLWNLRPAWQELDSLGRTVIQSLPLLVLSLGVILVGWFLSGVGFNWSQRGFSHRFKSRLLADVAARVVGIVIFVASIYLALRISGLTQIAATLVGGTGLLGLIIGIAFRDIAENFLASVLISVQRPFSLGDRVIIEGFEGYIQSVTMRGTLLMTLDGNHVQIPNSLVYKSTIQNLTANPNRRLSIELGIGYDDSISAAQEIILKVLREHEAVLDEPEPLVLAETLGSSTVTLRLYFWIDGVAHSPLKVRSSLVRLVKRAVQDAGISMPDEAREIIVPREIPIRLIQSNERNGDTSASSSNSSPSSAVATDSIENAESTELRSTHVNGRNKKGSAVASHAPHEVTESCDESTRAESGLASESEQLEKQAKQSRTVERGENLLAE